jgi:hypothetical protein
MINTNEITVIWIKRISEREDSFLKNHLQLLDKRFKVIVVGHTNLRPETYNFDYFPFFEGDIDSKGLICHKKNIGVNNAKSKYCLILHSDFFPHQSFYDEAITKNYEDNVAVAPVAYQINGMRALSWCEYPALGIGGHHKAMNDSVNEKTYISGGCIFGQKKLFVKYPWNENFKWGEGEDVEFSERLKFNGVKLVGDEKLIVHSFNSQ